MNLAALAWETVGWRISVIAVALVVWFWTQKVIGGKADRCDGIGDAIHDLTSRWHAWFTEHPKAADRALILSSLFIDGFGLFLIASSIFGPSFAPFLGVLWCSACGRFARYIARCRRRQGLFGATLDVRRCW